MTTTNELHTIVEQLGLIDMGDAAQFFSGEGTTEEIRSSSAKEGDKETTDAASSES